jgi:hypothetical protein
VDDSIQKQNLRKCPHATAEMPEGGLKTETQLPHIPFEGYFYDKKIVNVIYNRVAEPDTDPVGSALFWRIRIRSIKDLLIWIRIRIPFNFNQT